MEGRWRGGARSSGVECGFSDVSPNYSYLALNDRVETDELCWADDWADDWVAWEDEEEAVRLLT